MVGGLDGQGARRAVLFSGHLDTVPAGDNWEHEVLAADIDDGKIWGLGTTDMKAGVAAMLVAMRAVKQSGAALKGNLLFAGTAGEEIESMGAQELVREQKLDDIGFMVIGEPTGNRVITAEKGVLWLELRAKGQTSHGSLPHLGVNAIAHMSRLLEALQAEAIPYETHPLLGDFTMNIATIEGGVKTNVVPDSCRVTIDTRTVIGQDHQQIMDTVRQLIDRLCAEDPTLHIEVRSINERIPLDIPFDDPYVQTFVRQRDLVTGDTSVPTAATFATDGSVFVPAYEAPMVICGPGPAGEGASAERVRRDIQANRIRPHLHAGGIGSADVRTPCPLRTLIHINLCVTRPRRIGVTTRPQGHSREGGNPLPPKNLDSRLRGSDGLVFLTLGHGTTSCHLGENEIGNSNTVSVLIARLIQ